MRHYQVKAADILDDIYVKNLNAEAEHENGALRQALVTANQELYRKVAQATIDAAKILVYCLKQSAHIDEPRFQSQRARF